VRGFVDVVVDDEDNDDDAENGRWCSWQAMIPCGRREGGDENRCGFHFEFGSNAMATIQETSKISNHTP